MKNAFSMYSPDRMSTTPPATSKEAWPVNSLLPMTYRPVPDIA